VRRTGSCIAVVVVAGTGLWRRALRKVLSGAISYWLVVIGSSGRCLIFILQLAEDVDPLA